ncbi:IS3 family transposase [Microvirga makkahensis]|uniref:IS3 family transposase n=1 Tax=Microvirga makkahensis TaxID=1128670 RepID=A0A7X3MVH9_9HYPH|nr:IS3 family transposase [Microvirga makkahensis]
MSRIREKCGLSERHACRIVNQLREAQRYVPTLRAGEEALTQANIALVSQYSRYGYRRITALRQRIGWKVGRDRVQRIWRREVLEVPKMYSCDLTGERSTKRFMNWRPNLPDGVWAGGGGTGLKIGGQPPAERVSPCLATGSA